MTQKELLYVKTIADEHSISKAAQKLFIAQPSLSQAIQRIEKDLSTKLFYRTTSGLSLTLPGEKYYQMAVKILNIYDDFKANLNDLDDMKYGRISLGITNHLSHVILPNIIPEFHKLYPNIELNIVEDTSYLLEQSLIAGQISFAIMHAPKEISNSFFQYDILSEDPFIVVADKKSHLKDISVTCDEYPHPVIDLRQLKKEPFIMVHEKQRIRQITNTVLSKAGISHPHIKLTLRSYETAQLLAAKGIGITLLPSNYASILSSEAESLFLSIDKKYKACWNLCITTTKNGFLSKADSILISIIKRSCCDSK